MSAFKSTYPTAYASHEDSAIANVSDNLPSVFALRYKKDGQTVAVLHFASDREYGEPCYLLTVQGMTGIQESYDYDNLFPDMMVNLMFHNDVAISYLHSIKVDFDTIVVHDHSYQDQEICDGVLSYISTDIGCENIRLIPVSEDEEKAVPIYCDRKGVSVVSGDRLAYLTEVLDFFSYIKNILTVGDRLRTDRGIFEYAKR